jgi:hypothetical protein
MTSYSSGVHTKADEIQTRPSPPKSSTTSTTPNTDTDDAPNQPPLPCSVSQQEQTPRTCRICLESVHPEVNLKTGRTIYGGDSSEEGRLIRPCGCKGSQEYVHELCLKMYRHNRPLEASYIRCPTCIVGYRFNDSLYTGIAAHALVHACVTGLAVCAAIFIAGYTAIPLLSITIHYRLTLEYGIQRVTWYTSDRGWLDHLAQGTCLVGIWGLLFLPWDVLKMIRTGIVDSPILGYFGLVGFTGQAGLWPPVSTGVARVMYWVWCEIRIWVRRYIENGRARVIDLDDDGDI